MNRLIAVIVLVGASSWVSAAELAPSLAKVKAVGPEGVGSTEAASAWRELSRQSADALPALLAGLDGASPVAGNWIRAAVDAITGREAAAHRPLPVAALEAFLRDTRHAGQARRLAYELIVKADPTAPHRLLPTLLDDPGAELRYEAVAVALEAIQKKSKDDATARAGLERLLKSARDFGQVEAVAKELDERGHKVDLTAHFGFLTHWQLIASFDNTDGKGFQTAYPPEHAIDLIARVPGKGGADCTWKPYTSTENYGIVDLNKVIGKDKNAVAYGYTVVDSPKEQKVELRAASATALKMFLNGREVFARESYHQSFEPDSHIAPVTLTPGRNEILIKVCQNNQTEQWAQEWRFQLRISDALGAAVPVTPAMKESR